MEPLNGAVQKKGPGVLGEGIIVEELTVSAGDSPEGKLIHAEARCSLRTKEENTG